MEKIFVVLFLALLADAAFGMSFRRRRQSNDEDGELEDRYAWQEAFPSFNRPRPNSNDFSFQRHNRFPQPGQFPQPNPFPNTNVFPNVDPTFSPVTQPPNTTNGGTTTLSATVRECIRNCPVTSEYNPVCGSNGNTYDNPGRLSCAQLCGVDVTLLRSSRCPVTTPAPAAA